MSSFCDVSQYCACINFQGKLSIYNASYRLIWSLIWHFGSCAGLVSASMFLSYILPSHPLSSLDIFCFFISFPNLFPCSSYLVVSVTFLTLHSCPLYLSSLIIFPLSPYYMIVHFICSSYLLSPSWISDLETNSLYIASVMHLCGRAVVRRPLACWQVRIPPKECMCVSCERCVFSDKCLCDGPILRPEESYWVWYIWMWNRNLKNEVTWDRVGRCTAKKNAPFVRATLKYDKTCKTIK